MAAPLAMSASAGHRWPDAHERLEALARRVPAQPPGGGSDDVELYERLSIRLRATRRPSERRIAIDRTEECGLAVRRVDRARATVGFAACAGGPEAPAWALEAAARGARPVPRAALPRWPDAGAGSRFDLDALPTAVDPATLRHALVTLVEALRATLPKTIAPRIRHAWVETAVTVESLVTTSGLRRARARVRSWAYHTLEWRAGGEAFARPRLLAARGARVPDASLDPQRVATLTAAHRRTGGIAEPEAWVADADSAATLVRALARSSAGGVDGFGEREAGPGFRVVDRPSSSAGLTGGVWDDVGRATSDLAWISAPGGAWPAAGHLWRGSFRDPPAVLPSHLEVDPAPWEPPPGTVLLHDLRVHPLAPRRWAIEASATAGRIVFDVDAATLPRRCVGSRGVALTSAVGVTTPGLAFARSG